MAFKNRRKAFTLAEILVTLGVIGVIASMTVPTLIQDMQEAQYKTAWKKTFADLNQATQIILLDSAGDLTNYFSTVNYSSGGSNAMANKYKTYLKFIKECPQGQALSGGCFNWGQVAGFWQNRSTAVLNNGASISFCLHWANCSNTYGTLPNWCGDIIVDVNGLKGPNIIGKDIFNADVFKDRLRPLGSPGGWCDTNNCGDGVKSYYYLIQ